MLGAADRCVGSQQSDTAVTAMTKPASGRHKLSAPAELLNLPRLNKQCAEADGLCSEFQRLNDRLILLRPQLVRRLGQKC